MDESAAAQRYHYTLIDVDTGVLAAMTASPRHPLREFFPDDGPIVPKIGPGDVLSITIYETGAEELFGPATSQQLPYGTTNVTLPNQTVDRSGFVSVPFAPLVKVAGLTPMQAQHSIEQLLSGKAANPQVLVSVVSDATNVVTLTGAVKTPGRYRLTAASETLLQTVAMAGGPTGLETDTVLQLTRGRRQVGIRLSDLIAHPRDDIHAWPGDYIDLQPDPRNFQIYGGVYYSGAYSLVTDDITLAEAITRAGGLRDTQADSRGIFLFRYEDPTVLREVPKTQIIAAAPPAPGVSKDVLEPVLYKIDLKTASGIFYSTRLNIHDRDLIYIPTAPLVDWQKVLDLFRLTTAPVIGGASASRGL